MVLRKSIVALALLVAGSVIAYPIGGLVLVIALAMLWIDKIIYGEMKTPIHFGIEFYSLPAILVGIAYGPWVGFLFGFLAVPIIAGIYDILYPLLTGASHLDTGWEPFFPSSESFITGVIAVVAAFLAPAIPFFYVVLICMGVRFMISVFKDMLFTQPPSVMSYIINFALNAIVAFNLKFIVGSIILL